VALFHLDVYVPIWISVLISAWVTLFLIRRHLSGRVGMLMMVMWAVFALPFIHIVPYLWFDFGGSTPDFMWGLHPTNPYMFDPEIVQLTAMIGAVGGLGFAFGVGLAQPGAGGLPETSACHRPGRGVALSFPLWGVWMLIGVGLSWLGAPQETFLTANYTESHSLLEGANFGSAWMISYGLLIFAFCDAVLDSDQARRAWKLKSVLLAVAFVVIYLQLMRGDRESLPMVLGLFLAYYHWANFRSTGQRADRIWLKIGGVGVILLVVALVFGILRSSVAGQGASHLLDILVSLYDTGAIRISNLLYGTWSAVLLTPLSVAGDHINDLLRLGMGADYVDFLLSIPPGFVADAVGYARPIDGLSGPAWEMRYGTGGTHATVVPFLNFRMAGVLLVTAAWASALHFCEMHATKRLSVISLAFLCIMVTVSPHWLWYGEKYGMNAVVIWVLLWCAYRFSIMLDRAMQPPHPRTENRE